MEIIDKDLQSGVSFSQTKQNDHARETCTKVATTVKDYASKLLSKVEAKPNEVLTEQNAHNLAAIIFYDVQLQENMKELGMKVDGELILAINRMKSLQKLYLFEQKGGENYLEWRIDDKIYLRHSKILLTNNIPSLIAWFKVKIEGIGIVHK